MDIYNSIKPLPRGYRLSYSDPWCAAFVSAAAERVGAEEVIKECSCDEMIRLYKQQGRWQENYVPQSGDLVFYDWDKNQSADHVGVIVSVTGSVLKAIEGNVSNSVEYRVLSLTSPLIRGFATPFAHEKGSPVQGELSAKLTEGLTVALNLPQLSVPSAGNSVKALQQLLIGNGFSCGSFGADGDFGSATKNALIGYQKSKSLSPDGICGKQSWSALLL